jgi:hypothetical protein
VSAPATEALLAAGYALFLLLAAVVLDLLARHTHRRSQRFRTAGFRFHPHLDAWECPEGEHLHRAEVDAERRLIRYRARAHVCNACAARSACTDSSTGREIVSSLDDWVTTEAGRFHRGISLLLVALAALIASLELGRNHGSADAVLLLTVLAGALGVARRLARGVGRTAPSSVRL